MLNILDGYGALIEAQGLGQHWCQSLQQFEQKLSSTVVKCTSTSLPKFWLEFASICISELHKKSSLLTFIFVLS